MRTIKLSKPYTMPRTELEEVLNKVTEGLEKKFQIVNDWQGDVINFKRTGLNGSLLIKESELELNIKLGLLAASFSGVVKNNIVKYMEELIY